MPHQRNIDIDLLRSFVTIIESKSFTRAAQRLARTQSAISLQMKRLEEQLETRLFERGGRGVEPTEAGAVLLGYARRILAANDELVGRMVEPDVEGTIILRAPDGFTGQHLTPVLARFQRAFPRARLRTVTSPETAGGCTPDLIIRTFVDGESGAPAADRGDELLREVLTWCVAEGAERLDTVPGPLPLILPPAGHPFRECVAAALEAASVPWILSFEAASRWTMQAAISAGLGIGLLPRSLFASGLHPLEEADRLPQLPDAVSYLSTRPDAGPAADRLHTFLLQVFDQRG